MSDSIQQIPKGYKQTEVGVIPEDWELCGFKNIISKFIDYRGVTPKKLGMDWGGGDIRALSANNVQMGFIDFEKECYFASDKLYRRWMRNGDCEVGDILLTMEAPLGNVAFIPDNKKYILSQRTILIKPTKFVDKYFLRQYMSGSYFQKNLSDNATGSTAQGIQRQKLEKISVYYPPSKVEQSTIAGHLIDFEHLIQNLEKLIEKKKAIKKGTMQELLTGKKRLPGFSGEWEKFRLDELFNISAGRDLIKDCFSTEQNRDYPFPIYSNSLENEGLYGYTKRNRYRENCITITARGTIGRACSRNHKFDAIGRLLVLEPKKDLDCVFMAEYINLYINFSIESTGVPQLTAPQASKYDIVYPDPREQISIAETLEVLENEIKLFIEQRNKLIKIKLGMMQQLLTGKIRLVN